MTKFKLPIIAVAILAALVAGLFASGVVGGKDPDAGKKHIVEPVAMAEDFTVNLSDTDRTAYAVFGLALQLEPMSPEAYANWSGANSGGHGGAADAAPGPEQLAVYPKIRDAVVSVAGTFSAKELNSESGQLAFKEALLDRFAKIAEVDEAEHKASPKDPAREGIDPPYHVKDISFIKLVTQTD